MKPLATKFLSRKFLLHFFAFVIGTVALFLAKLTGDQWVMLVSVLSGSYGATNAAWHYADRNAARWGPTDKHID